MILIYIVNELTDRVAVSSSTHSITISHTGMLGTKHNCQHFYDYTHWEGG